MNKMGNRFYKRKRVGSRQGRTAGIASPENYNETKSWVLVCTDYPDKEFRNYKEFLDYKESLVKPKKTTATKKSVATKKETSTTTKEV